MKKKVIKKMLLISFMLSVGIITRPAAFQSSKKKSEKTRDLYYAAEHGDLELAKKIVEGQSQSWPIALLSRLDIRKHLEDIDSIVNESHRGYRPLYCAVENGHLNIVEYLVNHGAKTDFYFREFSPLHCAADRGHLDIVKFFIEKGENINAVTTHKEQTALFLAADKNPEPDYNYTDNSYQGCLDIIAYLAQNGANLSQLDRYQDTPLLKAIVRRNVSAVQCLIEHDAQVDEPNPISGTPMKLAQYTNQHNIIHILENAYLKQLEKELPIHTVPPISPEQLESNSFHQVLELCGDLITPHLNTEELRELASMNKQAVRYAAGEKNRRIINQRIARIKHFKSKK